MSPLSGIWRPLFFFNDTATTEIYTLSLHDALPISFPFARGSRRCPSRQLERHPARDAKGLVGRNDIEIGQSHVCAPNTDQRLMPSYACQHVGVDLSERPISVKNPTGKCG